MILSEQLLLATLGWVGMQWCRIGAVSESSGVHRIIIVIAL